MILIRQGYAPEAYSTVAVIDPICNQYVGVVSLRYKSPALFKTELNHGSGGGVGCHKGAVDERNITVRGDCWPVVSGSRLYFTQIGCIHLSE